MIARAKEELRAHVDRALLVRRKRDRRVPIPAQLLLVVRLRLNVAPLVRVTIYSPDESALRFRVKIIGIARVREHPEAVAAVHVFPLRIGDAARVLRLADP